MAFRSTGMQKNYQEENYSTSHSGGGSLMTLGDISSKGKLSLQFVSGRQKAADYVKMLNDLSLTHKGRCLCGGEWIFQQDNAAIHNASLTKNYLLEQKTRLIDHPACYLDLSPIENFVGLIVAKVYGGGRQYAAISKFKKQL